MTRPTLPRSLAAIVAAALAGALLPACQAADGGVVTLQQGRDDYAGCTAATLWGPKVGQPKGGGDDGVLYLRGHLGSEKYQAEVVDKKTGKTKSVTRTRYFDDGNRVLIRFDLPQGLRGRKLARARLEVFAPETRKVRMISEVLCREVTAPWTTEADWAEAGKGRKWPSPGGALDTETDYDNGRPGGAVDSVAFWEYDGRWFPHKYSHLRCPEGGRWMTFNVTPLAAKWLARPKSNHGVALMTITQGDKRFANRMEIDVPSPAAADGAKRPRLLMEFAPLKEPYKVAVTHTLRKYCDKSPRFRFDGPFEDAYEMAMARNESEGLQVLVKPIAEDLKGVTLSPGDLRGPGGATIPAADITWNPQEMVYMHRNGKTRDWYYHGKRFWIPDPLTTARPTDLRRHMAAPFWVTVRTRPETRPGTYTGTIAVRPTNAPPRNVRLTVKVWDYQIPSRWTFQTMGQSNWSYYWRAMAPHLEAVAARDGKEAAKAERAKLHRRYIDFLMDHRFMPTQQYSGALSPSLADIPYCVAERGGNTIYLNGNFRLSERSLKELRRRYDAVIALDEKLRSEGTYTHPERLIDMSLVYIGDETNKWDVMRRNSNAIRRVCPELMIMIGGSFPRKELDGVIDIYDPQIGGGSKTYSLREDMTGKIAESQARGERFFWYDAAGPMLPHPNVQCEEPLIAARVVFWMTWKYGVTGFEYYCYAIWSHNLPRKDKATGKWVRWPEKPFTPWGWGDTNGDGMLYYPGPTGPFSSVRFENIRDGIEDWESHSVLRDCVAALKAKGGGSGRAAELLARAEKLLKVPDGVVKNLRTWTWEPEVLRNAHRELGETIDAFSRLISEKELRAARLARKTAELARQRAMLKKRAAAARKAVE